MHQLYLNGYKREFKEYISKHKDSSSFSKITINPSELYTNSKNIIWEDECKEVIYEGVLYDVICVNGKGLTVELTVVSDNEEAKLKKQFASLYDLGSSQTTKGPFDLLKCFFALKYLATNSEFSFCNCIFSCNDYVSSQSVYFNSATISLDTPPPQFFAA